MAQRPTPALSRAREFLRDVVARGQARKRYRLPTVRELARLARVGPVSMLKAVQELAAEGLLDSRPKQGITIAGVRPAADVNAALGAIDRDAHLRTWERVYGRLQGDLLNGVYAAGRVCPSCKELAEKYGTSYQSLHTAMERLVATGALVRHKKSFLVPVLTRQKPGGSIVLVARGGVDGGLDVGFARAAEALRLLDEECFRRNLRLRVFAAGDGERPLSSSQTRELEHLHRGMAGPGDVLGSIVSSTGIRPRGVETLAHHLALLGKPVSVFDDSSGLRLTPAAGSPIRIFRGTDTQRAARRVGRVLLQLGHRRIAYVSPTHGARWSQERLAGLQSAFAEAGLPDGVHGVTCDRIVHTLQALRGGRTMADVTRRAVAQLNKSRDEACGMTAHMLVRLESLLPALMEEELLAEIELELFGRALTLTDATAWVMSSDYVASRALTYLKNKGVVVPESLSVVGFDDSIEAFVRGITSYNFDMLSVVRAMLGHVLDPTPAALTKIPSTVVEIEGFVTERSTTARVRASDAGVEGKAAE